jgi:YVTN family beta-propeller protein
MNTMKYISNRLLLSLTLIAAISFTSCKKDEPVAPSGNPGTPIVPGSGIFVTNEGNFQGGNAQVSFYWYSDSTTTQDLFRPMNGRPLGDVCQSMNIINGKAYVVVNNSGKIEVCRTDNFRSTKTITGFTSPRYIAEVAAGKAYVSDFFSGTIHILDLNTNAITGSIALPGMSEFLLVRGGEVYVSSLDHDQVYIINPLTDAVTDSIAVAKGGNTMVTDANGKIWLLCYGDYFTSAPGGLYRIDPATHSVEQSWPFTTADFPTELCLNETGEFLYYVNFSVYKMSIYDGNLPTVPFLQATTQAYYSVAVYPTSGEIYVTDAVDYSQRGHLLKYSQLGTLIDDKLVGVIPGGIYFY